MSRVSKLSASQMTVKDNESWHADYKDSAYIYAGGLPFELTEGDVVCIFSQYGEILDVNLIRDKKTGKSKGFAFLRYEDQRSTVLAVDNLAGSKILGRSLKVDHVSEYKQPKGVNDKGDEWDQDPRMSMNVAPAALFAKASGTSAVVAIPQNDARSEAMPSEDNFADGIDPDDPMYDYLVEQRRAAALRKASTVAKESKHRTKDRSKDHERSRHHSRSRARHGEQDHRHRSRHGEDKRHRD